MIKMKTRAAGPRGVFLPGAVTDEFGPEEEKQLIDGGYAERIRKPRAPKVEEKKVAEPETATIAAPEKATAPPSRRRKKAE